MRLHAELPPLAGGICCTVYSRHRRAHCASASSLERRRTRSLGCVLCSSAPTGIGCAPGRKYIENNIPFRYVFVMLKPPVSGIAQRAPENIAAPSLSCARRLRACCACARQQQACTVHAAGFIQTRHQTNHCISDEHCHGVPTARRAWQRRAHALRAYTGGFSETAHSGRYTGVA